MPIGFVLSTTDWWMGWHRGEIYQVSTPYFPFLTNPAVHSVTSVMAFPRQLTPYTSCDEVSDAWLANPALPDDILREAVPGNIRRAEHFLAVLRRLVRFLDGRLDTEHVENEMPVAFVASIHSNAGIDQKMLRFCYDRLHSLMMTLEITDTDEFMHIQTICDFATLIGTYTRGFSIIIEPYDDRMPDIRDPVIQVPILIS